MTGEDKIARGARRGKPRGGHRFVWDATKWQEPADYDWTREHSDVPFVGDEVGGGSSDGVGLWIGNVFLDRSADAPRFWCFLVRHPEYGERKARFKTETRAVHVRGRLLELNGRLAMEDVWDELAVLVVEFDGRYSL